MGGGSGSVSRAGNPARRRRAAFAASVVLHVGIAWLVQRVASDRRVEPRRPVVPAEPVSISIVETPERRSRPERAQVAPTDRRPEPKRATPRTGHVAAPAPPEPERLLAPEPIRAPAAGAPPQVAPPKIDLSFAALPQAAQQRVTVPPAGEDVERLLVPPADRPRTVDQLRADFERRAAAIENVRAGRADPLHFDYLRGARERLTPEATRIAEELPLGPAETVKGWGRGYLGRLGEINRGTARDLPESPRDDPFGPRPDVLGGYREMERQAASGAVERTAHVCLGVAPGHDVVVTLRRSSGNAALDRVALDSFRASANARPVAAEVRPGLACYRVRISAYRIPPTPSIGFGWKNGPKVLYPLKRITEVSVELESLDYGARPGAPPLVPAR